nr:MAG TPA: hypothetical protein [Caudoviricetes sp.]
MQKDVILKQYCLISTQPRRMVLRLRFNFYT